jgi:3-oxoacyl-[acyl-carrier protein] reductase
MNIIVIGGTRGIGKEVVKIFAGDPDNRLIVTGRNEESLKRLEKEFINVKSVVLDLMEFDNLSEKFRDAVYSYFDRIDILINMAGLLIKKDFEEFSGQEARSVMETNFFGPASVIRALKPVMARGSHIVNISSMGGFQGSSKYRGLSYYSASKAALACLTECLAGEFSESSISVNCLALGSVQTEMVEEAFPGYKAPVEPGEMAEFVADFALNGNKYFNGKILPVAITNP